MSSPTWRDLLKDGFRYDDYANRAWLPVVVEHGTEAEIAVFQHLLSASEIWLQRVEGKSLTERPVMALTPETLDHLVARWSAAVEALEFDQEVTFTTFRGDTQSRPFGDIVRHVHFHGTYHRGQIRASLGERGIDFPDTDYMLFSYEREG